MKPAGGQLLRGLVALDGLGIALEVKQGEPFEVASLRIEGVRSSRFSERNERLVILSLAPQLLAAAGELCRRSQGSSIALENKLVAVVLRIENRIDPRFLLM